MTRHILIDAQQLIVHIFRLSHDYRHFTIRKEGSKQIRYARKFNVRELGVGRTCKYQAGLTFRAEIWKYNMDIT